MTRYRNLCGRQYVDIIFSEIVMIIVFIAIPYLVIMKYSGG